MFLRLVTDNPLNVEHNACIPRETAPFKGLVFSLGCRINFVSQTTLQAKQPGEKTLFNSRSKLFGSSSLSSKPKFTTI